MKRNKKKKKSNKRKISQLKANNPDNFFNKEISWLDFNLRVLNEAADERTPLLERLRFLSIYTTNLDEFMMKRVGGLKRQKQSEYTYTSIDGLDATSQLEMIQSRVLQDNIEQEKIYFDLKDELKENNIEILHWEDLSQKEIEFSNAHFDKKLFPVLTPLSVDPGKPFPFISNLSFSFGIYLREPIEERRIFSRVKVPSILHTWLRLPTQAHDHYRLIDTSEIIRHNLQKLYHGIEIEKVMPFRVTRNADWDHDDEDTEDLLELIEESVNYRRLQEAIRIECPQDIDKDMLNYLLKELDLGQEDVYLYKELISYPSLDAIADIEIPQLRYPNWKPITFPWYNRENIFRTLKERDFFVHHPYESFQTSVENFIVSASKDERVLSIKMTLYRTGDNSRIIKALIEAAENGIQVVCLIELKARFDEKRNIVGAKRMEEAGVHVVYGIVGLKTHSKIALVVRSEIDGELKRYCHIGTGNYNSKTAKLYTDMGLLTVNEKISEEVNEIFNYLTGSSLKIDYKYLLVAPINAKSNFLRMIKQQSKKARLGKKVRIVAKMNSLEDVMLIEALYEASSSGVEIILIVRGYCCLIPGKKGLSENIKVLSVIGRFLEHSRVFFFSDGEGDWSGDYYIGSADWMHRNMHSRVEVIVPIFANAIKKQISEFLEVILKDERSVWELKESGKYIQRSGKKASGTHEVMMSLTTSRYKLSDS